MNETSLFDNTGQYVQRIHAEHVICHLRDLTSEKTQNAVSVGFFGKPDGARISLMKSGKMRITRDCLENFSKHYDFNVDHLIEKIMPEKTEAVAASMSIVNDEKFSEIIIDKSNRERFLCALQGLLEIRDGVIFRATLNKGDSSYYLQFCATGKVPQAWLDLILLQLQQLGLPLGFRSHVIWWNDFLNHHYHKHEKKHNRGNHHYEGKHLKKIYKQINKQKGNSKIVTYARQCSI